MLNEKRIKCLLLDFIEEHYKPAAVGVEVPFLAGKRWADVLLITGKKQLVAFEIKSDRDSLRRLSKQLEDYTRTFNQVYVILSRKFRNSAALRSLPESVGYAFIDGKSNKIEFARDAKNRTRLSKKNLLFFLWKKDLSRYRRKEIDGAELLRARMERAASLRAIKGLAVDALLGRYRSRYETFCREKSKHVHEEDLDYLTKTVWGTF